jgi:hypothetical protein
VQGSREDDRLSRSRHSTPRRRATPRTSTMVSATWAKSRPVPATSSAWLRDTFGMAHLNFGGDRELQITVDDPSGLRQGAGLHMLTFPVTVDARRTIGGGVPIDLRGQAWLGAPHQNWLGTLSTDGPVVTREGIQTTGNLVLSLSDEQLAVIEDRRAGGDLQFYLDIFVVLGYDPAAPVNADHNERWPAGKCAETVLVQSGPWERLLAQTAAAMSLAIVVPVPLGQSAAGRVGGYLRSAVAKVNDNDYEGAVIAARKAIEAMGVNWPTERQVIDVNRAHRTVVQRLAMLRHAAYSMACLAPHADEVAGSMTWDRSKALAVIAAVSALAACLPAEVAAR